MYDGPLQSDTQTLAWSFRYKLSPPSKFIFFDASAVEGALVWIQKGDRSKPTLVVPHALFGTPMGSFFHEHLPDDVPIIAIQAPELLGKTSITTISERISFYRDLLISELADYNPCIHNHATCQQG